MPGSTSSGIVSYASVKALPIVHTDAAPTDLQGRTDEVPVSKSAASSARAVAGSAVVPGPQILQRSEPSAATGARARSGARARARARARPRPCTSTGPACRTRAETPGATGPATGAGGGALPPGDVERAAFGGGVRIELWRIQVDQRAGRVAASWVVRPGARRGHCEAEGGRTYGEEADKVEAEEEPERVEKVEEGDGQGRTADHLAVGDVGPLGRRRGRRARCGLPVRHCVKRAVGIAVHDMYRGSRMF